MKLEKIYEYAQAHEINIDFFPLTGAKSLSLPGNIAINEKALETETEKICCLAHELGHCETGSFYNIHCKYDIREKHEYRADKWAFQYLIPPEEVENALEKGMTEEWQLAEYFDVTEHLLHKALEYYKNNQLIFDCIEEG